MITALTIRSLISHNDELSRLLPLISGITIIEYDGENIEGSKGLYEYLLRNDLSVIVVNRIIICGKRTEKLLDNISMLRALFPHLDPEVLNKDWHDADFNSLNVYDVLVFHMAGDVITDGAYDNYNQDGKRFREIVKLTRQAYYVCVLSEADACWFFGEENQYCLRVQLRLYDFESEEGEETPEPTAFCLEKQKYIQMCGDALTHKDFFFQCVDEVDHGCEECNQCSKYGKRKQCPFAQRKIADFYRRGMYVPKDEKIAHQWEMMSSRQGHKPARIQVADDLLNGFGCKQSAAGALEIYKEYAQRNDVYCINRIIELAEVSDVKERIAAIPYIAQLAQFGNEEMILKLSDAFQCGEYGLPKDIVQQKEWIRQGADNGNPRFVKAMAELCEANNDWEEAYQWYKKLAEVSPGTVSESKLDEVELKMLTNGANADEIAQKGMDYLYGYHGMERDTHLAYRCLNYAKEKNIPLAKGLLGQMYFYGLGVEQSSQTGIRLIAEATKDDDMLSMEKFVYVLHADEVEDDRWINDMVTTIENEINKENPYAFYLKGKCCLDGRLYKQSKTVAFDMMRNAAKMGYPPAQYHLAMMFKDGTGTSADSYKYRHWIEISAKNGHYEAEGIYGVILYKDYGSRSNAFKFLRNAFDQGFVDSEAEWCLAQCYMNGIGTPKDLNMAYPMYIKAAEEGNADAQVKLCEDYFKGNASLPKDYKECARWGEAAIAQDKKGVRFMTAYASSDIGKKERAYALYLELADEGNSAAMNNLGCLEEEQSKAFEWFLKAADMGDEVAQNNVARYYRYGIATDKDEQKALEYYIKSANQGYLNAIIVLARLYQNGDCTDKNLEEAIKWYEKAISKGSEESILDLASLYINDLDDIEKAIHFYKQAAEKGSEKAIFELGKIYENGFGGEVYTHKAIFWYRKAAANGNEKAKESLKRLGANWIVNGKIEDDVDDGDIDTNNISADNRFLF